MSIWGVLASSREHRRRLINTLTKFEVTPDITLEAMVAFITPNFTKHTLAFTEKDLPPEGADHNKPLHITMKCLGKWVPAILIDNGSTINVCPLQTAYCLELKNKDFTPATLGVRNTRCDVIGTVNLELVTGQFKTAVEFYILEIPTSFNLLLGRPWLHCLDVMGVPSTLH